ncbi:Fc.00g102520.m01.CDS01 [Cosmosporella sp. VM-42]
MAARNSWLRAQLKGDLVELANSVGLQNMDEDDGLVQALYEGLKKTDLESALDEYLAENASRFASNPELTGYFNSRSKALGSPVKRESRSDELKVARRRQTTTQTKLSEEVTPDDESATLPVRGISTATLNPPTALIPTPNRSLVQTPGRSLSQVAARIPLPATPADVANAVDRSAVAIRQRASSIYQESGITEASNATRDALSTVTSVLFCVAAFELYHIRPEVLGSIFAFTIPAISFLGTPDYPVYLPDMFLLLTSSFWSPALTWAFTSFILPSFAGYFFNLNASRNPPAVRGRPRANSAEYVVDPLTFSIVKALVSYVVYAQGVTFSGLLSDTSIERLNGAVYGGYKGMLVGTAITGLVSIYDAVLKK